MRRERLTAFALLVLVSIGAGAVLAFVALRPDSSTRAHGGRRVPFLEQVKAAGVIGHYRVSRRIRLPRLLDVHLLPDSAFRKAQAIFRSACSEYSGARIVAGCPEA